jgi:asparagine synthase (glutamine-hydrolysing)
MCGIAGIITFDGSAPSVDVLRAMADVMAHRGPDGDGVRVCGPVGLSHRRLAIIDPALGAQPFVSDDGAVAITFNGELYNYVEVRRELGDAHFRTESDTEVLLRAYERWGIDCIGRFRGMFAFAIHDARRRVAYVVRDRLGIKPLYYYQSSARFAFASELGALTACPDVPREIDPHAIAGFLRYQYVPTPLSVYRGVSKLRPGHVLTIDLTSGQVTDWSYWELRVAPRERGEAECLEELNTLLDDTIRIYVRSDVPFGSFLSGGVDSSLVTALMARHLGDGVRAFSIGFREEQYSELPYAREAGRTLRTEHLERIVSWQNALDMLDRAVTHFGEPFADSSAVPTYYVCHEAAQHVKMVLSGDGGDELFGGYPVYPATFLRSRKLHRRWPLGPMFELWRRSGIPVLERRSIPMAYTNREWYESHRALFDDTLLEHLLAAGVEPYAPREFDLEGISWDADPVSTAQAYDVKSYMLDDILTKVDRMSMANSLEVRVPLLDHRVVEFAFSLPLGMRLRANGSPDRVRTKYLLKQSARRFFTDDFLERPKMGFGIPVRDWVEGPLRRGIEDALRDSTNPIYQWLDFQCVQRVMDWEYVHGHDWSARLWLLYMLHLWLDRVHLAVAPGARPARESLGVPVTSAAPTSA